MEKTATKIEGAWILDPIVFGDERGFFLESWNRETFRRLGLSYDFVQDNHSRSARWVLRGLHYQIGDAAQGKLVWVTTGTVFDVIVDLRKNSPTFGLWDAYELNASTHRRLWIPAGCAHGFLVLSETADFQYKVTAPYMGEAERTLRWDDAHLGIEWPLDPTISPTVSARDSKGASFYLCEKYP